MSSEINNLKPKELEDRIRSYKNAYEARFERNQYANNAIIGASILLGVLIAITATSPAFKDP